MKILGYPNGSGASYWRMIDPFRYLNRLGGFDAQVSDEAITEKAASWADVYMLQSIVDMDGIALLYQYQQEQGKKIVVDCDDYMEVDETNPHALEHKVLNAAPIIKRTMQIANLVTTTTPTLAEYLRQFNPNVVVIPNYLDGERFNGPNMTHTGKRLRLGWAGSITHLKDIPTIERVLKDLMDKHPLECVFMGEPRFKEIFAGYPVECPLGVPFDFYPDRLRGLALDLAIAPLAPTEFNRYKSWIKPMEYGIMGIPTVASRIEPYLAYEHVIPLAQSEKQWKQILGNLIASPELRTGIGQSLQSWTKTKLLGDHIEEWANAFRSLL